jgi:hypothetical protein
MDEYAGAARPGSKGGRSVDGSLDGHSDVAGSSASLWDSPEHVQLTINLLSSTLAGARPMPCSHCFNQQHCHVGLLHIWSCSLNVLGFH